MRLFVGRFGGWVLECASFLAMINMNILSNPASWLAVPYFEMAKICLVPNHLEGMPQN